MKLPSGYLIVSYDDPNVVVDFAKYQIRDAQKLTLGQLKKMMYNKNFALSAITKLQQDAEEHAKYPDSIYGQYWGRLAQNILGPHPKLVAQEVTLQIKTTGGPNG